MNILRKLSESREHRQLNELKTECMNKTKKIKSIKIKQLKNTVNEMKKAIESFSNMFKQAEERICELKDRYLEIIHRRQKKLKLKRNKESLCGL